ADCVPILNVDLLGDAVAQAGIA
ncbi:MAG: hypothetical protein K0S78_6295, partial [Thermomicrobiales bacterium]|nr:hypothetical protein [Thermomicrobiales bacterium]